MAGFQCLVTLPASMSGQFAALEGRELPDWFATHDPGRPVGSGGGTANLLAEAYQATQQGETFAEWLKSRPKLVVHSGGQSRRLPAYAAAGKALMPISVERGSVGQPFDQTLLDLQTAEMDDLFDRVGPDVVVAIISGDSLLRASGLPRRLPSADVVCLGFEAPAEEATVFGTFFTPWSEPTKVDFVLQKPSPERINALSDTHRCLVDAGVWFLTERATFALMAACGWDDATQTFPNGVRSYDLYSDFGVGLGAHPSQPQAITAGLSSAVVPAGDEFYHFGTNRQLLDAVIRLQGVAGPVRSDLGFTTAARRRLNQHALNTVFERMSDFAHEAKVWIENSFVVTGSTFAGNNLVTNLPVLPFAVHVPYGRCIDFVPVGEDQWCVRVYGFDDRFSGKVGSLKTLWLGDVPTHWLKNRGLSMESARLDPEQDIQESPLFPIGSLTDFTPERLAWLTSPDVFDHAEHAEWWQRSERISAQEIQTRANMPRLYAQRKHFRDETLEATLRNHTRSIFFSTDLERAAADLATGDMAWDAHPLSSEASPAQRLHERMFRSQLLRYRGDSRADALEAGAFKVLQEVIVGADWLKCQVPHSTLLPDQIIWGRCPLRMDLAGGWTDTPPYAMLYGGRVVNVAVELNGQPPVQVFGRVLKEPRIVLRSIDLGTELQIRSFDDLRASVGAGSEFSLAKTALALSGFTPQFLTHAESSLERQLMEFGGGIELTMLAAVPKGSGLGTSSILSAAILSVLSQMCGHFWNHQQVFDRVSASEQMLTTGGGWQDQVGGVLPGLKLVTTPPGIRQEVAANWLPDQVMNSAIAEGAALLYYTGITRMAKDVLKEIVRGMFLNSGPRLATLRKIGANTEATVEALQTRSYEMLGAAIRQSWVLNQRLDIGTNPPAVAKLYDLIDDLSLGAKLLGAGGGGYMFILAKDPEAARRVRTVLANENQSTGARFVDLAVSQTGLEVSKS